MNPFDPTRCRTLAKFGLEVADFLILSTVEDSAASKESVVNRATRFNNNNYRPPLPPSAIIAAAESLLSRSLLHEHTKESAATHTNRIASLKATLELGPIDESVAAGDIDFADDGAKLFRSCCEALVSGYENQIVSRFDVADGRYVVCSRSRDATELFAKECIRETTVEQIVRMSSTEKIGRWCDKWWRVFTDGWLICVEYTR